MSKPKCDIRVGTSGWHYAHWTGRFYPADLPKSKWFEFYSKEFDTVEINNTFYQLPKKESVKKWYEKAPDNFVFTVKANRFITHIKKLKEASESLRRFLDTIVLFKEKLGPVLYQLPPSLRKDLDLLESFACLLPKEQTSVFEFRHKSWFSDDTYELLNRFGLGFCVHDLGGVETPRLVTGEVVYMRFHGTSGRYAGNYSKPVLRQWADWAAEQIRDVRAIYAYFNNDFNAYAVANARTLREQLLQ